MLPCGMLNVAGTDVEPSLDDKVTVAPFFGAGAFKLMIPVVERPPITDPGLKVKELSCKGLTVIGC